MNHSKDIAVVGMTCRLPYADTIKQFEENLSKGLNCVTPITENRINLLGLDPSDAYMECGYLEDIEYFDYKFFNLTKQEAILMDPHHRIGLEMVAKTIGDAGYSLQDFKGSNTAVITGTFHNTYNRLLSKTDAFKSMNDFAGVFAGRLAYEFDLRGPTSVVDSTCSSSLYGVHHAVTLLTTNQVDAAIVGAAAVEFSLNRAEDVQRNPLGVSSVTYKSRAYDDKADGTASGEGAAFVLLKRYEDAVKDRDQILAVIKGSAANHDGGRSSNMAAPSAAGQTECMLKAWKQAQIDPSTIQMIEGHGTGTKVGDPIEVQGLTDAFKQHTDRVGFVSLGSVKTNLGHLGSPAGLVGLIKTILSIRHKKLYPLVHFKQPNTLINFKEAAVYPQAELARWQTEKKRVAGVSSFGISGTNVHLIVAESDEITSNEHEPTDYAVRISAPTKQSFALYKKDLAKWVQEGTERISDICFTLNVGRGKNYYHAATRFSNKAELVSFLENAMPTECDTERKLVLLASDTLDCSEAVIRKLCENYQVFQEYWIKITALVNIQAVDVRKIAYLICIYETFKASGITPQMIIGKGVANILVDYATEKVTLEQALEQAKLYEGNTSFNQADFTTAIQSLVNERTINFVNLGSNCLLSDCVLTKVELGNSRFIQLDSLEGQFLSTVLANLENDNVSLDWQQFYKTKDVRRVSLPVYPFERTKVWPEQIREKKAVLEEAQKPSNQIKSIKEQVVVLWSRELGIATIDDNDDFFELGANSLMGMSIVNTLEKDFHIEMDFEDFYDYPTVVELTAYIKKLMQEKSVLKTVEEINKAERPKDIKASYNQKRMLYLQQNSKDNYHYNMPLVFDIKGELDFDILKESIEYLFERHEILRTVYEQKEGEFYQKIRTDYVLDIEKHAITETAALEIIDQDRLLSFDLSQELPVRIKVFEIGEKEYVWYLNVHHIIADGSSVEIFVQEFSEIYSQLIKGEEPELVKLRTQYADVALKEHAFLVGERGREQLNYWKSQLASLPAQLEIPLDYERPEILTHQGGSEQFTISKELTSKLQSFNRKNKTSLFMMLELIFAIELAIYSGDDDVCIGVPIANRNEQTKNLVGFFANTLVLRNKVDRSTTFIDLLERTKRMIIKSFSNAETPFEMVVSHLSIQRSAAHTPVFQHSFALQNFREATWDISGISIENRELDSVSSKFELALILTETTEEIHGRLEYNTNLFKPETIINFIENYLAIIEQTLHNPQLDIHDLEMDQTQIKAKNLVEADYFF